MTTNGQYGYDQYGNNNANQNLYGDPNAHNSGYGQGQPMYGQQQQQQQYAPPPPAASYEPLGHEPKMQDVMDEYEVHDRMKFVRKVYSILASQLTMTVLFIVAVQTQHSVRDFFGTSTGMGLYITCAVGSIVTCIMIVCCFGRTTPLNYGLLLAFTVCETVMVGGITSRYEPSVVMMAGGATALTTVALTVYAFRTKVNIEVFMAMTFVVYMAMFPIMIMGFFVWGPVMNIVWCCLGVLFYGLYLVIDTMMIVRGKSMNGYGCSYDDFVVGALMLYMDIIMLFIYLLRLFGDR